MANRPYMLDAHRREARQRAYQSAPTLETAFPAIAEVAVELRFMLASGQPHSSPHSRIFRPDMQAFFQFQCPERACMDGGFDLTQPVTEALKSRKTVLRTVACCAGRKSGETCGLELHFSVLARRHESAKTPARA